MSGFTIEFSPWGKFHAQKNTAEIHRWLKAIGDAGTEAFRGGMGYYPPASDPGAWPNNRTGRLSATIRSEVTSDSVTIGTSMHYSKWLRKGTSVMKRRKMSDNALEEGVRSAGRLTKWVEFVRG